MSNYHGGNMSGRKIKEGHMTESKFLSINEVKWTFALAEVNPIEP
jgi:hypothetical protein